jgi:hypothetical protein
MFFLFIMNIKIFKEKTYFPTASKVVPHIVLYLPGDSDQEYVLAPTSYNNIELGIGFEMEPGHLMVISNFAPLCTGDKENLSVNGALAVNGEQIKIVALNMGQEQLIMHGGDPVCIAHLTRIVHVMPGDGYEAQGGTQIPVKKDDVEKKRSRVEEME